MEMNNPPFHLYKLKVNPVLRGIFLPGALTFQFLCQSDEIGRDQRVQDGNRQDQL